MPISVIAIRNNRINNLLQVDLGFSTHIYLDLNAEIRNNTITEVMRTGGVKIKEFLINKILSEYKESLAIQSSALETKLREKLENKSKIELMTLKIKVEIIARIVPKKS